MQEEKKYIKALDIKELEHIEPGHTIKIYGKETTVKGFYAAYNEGLEKFETIILTEGRGDPFERSLDVIEVLPDQPWNMPLQKHEQPVEQNENEAVFTEADANFMRECDIYPKADGGATIITENDEGAHMDADELRKLSEILHQYANQKQTMTPEHLLIERYKVIAPDTSGRLEVGDIFYRYYFESSTTGIYTYTTNPSSPLEGMSVKKEFVETMPHLFQPLPWWSDRKPEDMPEYVKDENGVYQVQEWHIDLAPKCTVFIDSSIHEGYIDECTECPLYSDMLPATREEYEQWKQSKDNL